jgi:hypothetical protein
MSQRFDHYGYPVFGRFMYDNSRVEPESWEEEFSEEKAELVDEDTTDEPQDSVEPME